MPSYSEPLTFEAFRALLADLLHVEAELVKSEAYFITDLGVDSLRMFGLMLYLERLGVKLPLESLWRIQTVGEAYQHYVGVDHGQDRAAGF